MGPLMKGSPTGGGRPLPVVMAHGQSGAEMVSDGSPSLTCNHEAPIVFDPAQVTSVTNRSNPQPGDPCHTLHRAEPPMLVRMREGKEGGGKGPLVSEDQSLTLATANDQVLAFTNRGIEGEVHETLRAGSHGALPMTATGTQVRRLTPKECEALQGFPRGYTNIPWRGKPESPDGPRYRALGNSWAVPCARWIGERIKAIKP